MSARLPNEAGFVDLECAECRCLYSVRNPALDEIENPRCRACREAPVEGCSEGSDETYPLSRGD